MKESGSEWRELWLDESSTDEWEEWLVRENDGEVWGGGGTGRVGGPRNAASENEDALERVVGPRNAASEDEDALERVLDESGRLAAVR